MIPDTAVVAAVIASGVTFMVFAQLARGRAVAERGGSLRVSTGRAQVVPYFFPVPYAVVFFHLGPEVQLSGAIVWLGVALALGGVVVAIRAIATLGRHYDLVLEIHAGHQLVRRGPFRWTRHPVYTGLILHFIGACLATGNLLLAGGTIAVTIPALVARARAEERLLRDQFGAEYGRYAREVPMLVPGLRGATRLLGRGARRRPIRRS